MDYEPKKAGESFKLSGSFETLTQHWKTDTRNHSDFNQDAEGYNM